MATLTNNVSVLKHGSTHIGWYTKWIAYLQGWKFGIVAMSIAISSMLGGISLMYSLKSHAQLWEIALTATLVLAVNSCAVLAESVKWTVNLFIIAFIINLSLILLNFSPISY